MKTQIELSRPLRAHGPDAARAMLAILDEASRHVSPHEREALTLDLSSPALPASVSVQIDLDTIAKPDQYACALAIRARDNPAWFPTFEGTASISPLRAEGSELWLQGTYDPPFGKAGAAVDSTLFHGVAHATLERFVAWLADGIERRIATWSL